MRSKIGILKQNCHKLFINASSVSLRLPPYAPVSATPTHMLRICVNSPVSATPTHMLRICVNSPTMQNPSIANRQKKKSKSIPLFLLTKKAQKKKLPKRKRRNEISRSAECLPSLGDADTHAPRMCQFPPLSVDDTAF